MTPAQQDASRTEVRTRRMFARAFSELVLTEATAFQWIFLKKIHLA
jgi:hypothetical protein